MIIRSPSHVRGFFSRVLPSKIVFTWSIKSPLGTKICVLAYQIWTTVYCHWSYPERWRRQKCVKNSGCPKSNRNRNWKVNARNASRSKIRDVHGWVIKYGVTSLTPKVTDFPTMGRFECQVLSYMYSTRSFCFTLNRWSKMCPGVNGASSSERNFPLKTVGKKRERNSRSICILFSPISSHVT